MKKLKIIKMGHPTLRKVARELTLEEIHSGFIKNLIQDMYKAMQEATGIGLAAPQVNYSLSMALIDRNFDEPEDAPPQDPPYEVYINPKITVVDPTLSGHWEGCLSVPGLRGFVERPRHVRVDYLDQEGRPKSVEAQDFKAVVLQHELDHLIGKLYVDRITDRTKLLYEEEWESYLKENPKEEGKSLED